MLAAEKSRENLQEILGKPIRDLGLKLEGSQVERFVRQLYEELNQKGLSKFRPACYLTDEWGCPSGEPIIGIPFYLANPDLASLEKEMNDLEDKREIMLQSLAFQGLRGCEVPNTGNDYFAGIRHLLGIRSDECSLP